MRGEQRMSCVEYILLKILFSKEIKLFKSFQYIRCKQSVLVRKFALI